MIYSSQNSSVSAHKLALYGQKWKQSGKNYLIISLINSLTYLHVHLSLCLHPWIQHCYLKSPSSLVPRIPSLFTHWRIIPISLKACQAMYTAVYTHIYTFMYYFALLWEERDTEGQHPTRVSVPVYSQPQPVTEVGTQMPNVLKEVSRVPMPPFGPLFPNLKNWLAKKTNWFASSPHTFL